MFHFSVFIYHCVTVKQFVIPGNNVGNSHLTVGAWFLRYWVPKSGAKGDCGHFQSLQQHVDGCIWLARYDFLLVFCSDVTSRCHYSQQNPTKTMRNLQGVTELLLLCSVTQNTNNSSNLLDFWLILLSRVCRCICVLLCVVGKCLVFGVRISTEDNYLVLDLGLETARIYSQ